MTMDVSHLTSLLGDLSSARVLCVGDIMIDRFIYGTVDRISPEAPVPVFHVGRETDTLGGAGNVVRNLQTLGAKTIFCGIVGEDELGERVQALLGELSNVNSSLITDPHRKTTTKTRFLADGQQLLRTDYENAVSLEDRLRQKIYMAVEKALPNVDSVILSDYGKGVFDRETLGTIIDLARKAKKPVIVDPKGIDYGIYRGATVLTPNAKELREASRQEVKTDEEVIQAATSLLKDYGVEAVLATRGPQGMTLVQKDRDVFQIPTRALEVYDVSGAGDTVVATLGAALALGTPLEVASSLANEAAGIVVGKVGTATVSRDELETRLNGTTALDWSTKLMTADDGENQVVQWHRQGYKVGFTNGCFDLLHPGHLSSLRQAQAQCDRLVVALNSDASVRKLKGPTRPVQDEKSRAKVLSSLVDVDLVIIFEDETPLALIQKLRPDILIKGADYANKEVVGAKDVESWGGRVFLAKLEPRQSTTQTVEKMTKEEVA